MLYLPTYALDRELMREVKIDSAIADIEAIGMQLSGTSLAGPLLPIVGVGLLVIRLISSEVRS
jgi:hypothetical protein